MKNLKLLMLLFCLNTNFMFSQNVAEVLIEKGGGLVIGGYGEIHLNVKEDANNKVDVHRLVTLLGYNFNDKVQFVSEIEFEHVNEVYVEQAFLSYAVTDNLNLRAGLMLVPMGIVNEYHEPTTFNGVERPGMDKSIVPSTWREIGFGLNGRMDNASLKYQLYLFNGFKSDGLGGSNGIRSGRQKGAEAMWNTTNVSVDVDWYGVQGFKLGVSGYFGDSNVDEGADVPGVGISMIGLDARYTNNRFGMRGQYITTSIDNTEEYNTVWDSDLGSKMNGWYMETSYNIMASDKTERLDLFARYSNYDTHAAVVGSLTRNNAYNRNVLTTGLSWHVAKGAAFKMDYQILGDEGSDDTTSVINFGMGVWF
ncbi:MAG: hypothetical protein ABGW67_05990 [Flavobacteriaceae bacterium]|jgi:hypothetical protein|nr:hypothetical protein [Flavobacteriaceae bacterium]